MSASVHAGSNLKTFVSWLIIGMQVFFNFLYSFPEMPSVQTIKEAIKVFDEFLCLSCVWIIVVLEKLCR